MKNTYNECPALPRCIPGVTAGLHEGIKDVNDYPQTTDHPIEYLCQVVRALEHL